MSAPAPVAGRRKGIPTVPDSSASLFVPPPSSTSALLEANTLPWLEDDGGGTAASAHANPSATRALGQTQPQSPAAAQHPLARRRDDDASLDFLALLGSSDDHPAAGAAPAPPPLIDMDKGEKRDSLRREWRRLKAELKDVERDTEASKAAVSALESGSHELCRGAEELQAQYDALKVKEREALASMEGARQDAGGKVALLTEKKRGSLSEAEETMRQELEGEHKQRLAEVQRSVDEQENAVAAARAALEAMQSTVGESSSSNPMHTSALDRLQSALLAMMNSTQREFLLQVKPVIARCIQEQTSDAVQQRRDIDAADHAQRADLLLRFTQKQEEVRFRFQQEHKEAMRSRRHEVFGSFKARAQADAQAQLQETQRRLAVYRGQVAESIRSIKTATEERIQQLAEAAMRAVSEGDGRHAVELKRAREEQQLHLQLFRQRAEAERRNLLATARRSCGDADHDNAMLSAKGGEHRKALSSLQGDLESTGRRMEQMRIAVGMETNLLHQQRQQRDQRASLGTRAEKDRLDVERALGASSQQFGVALQQLKRDVADWQGAAQDMKKALQEKRMRLTVLHDAADRSRRTWEADIRRALCEGLTENAESSLSGLATKESITADVIESLCQSLAGLQRQMQLARDAHAQLFQGLQEKARLLEKQRGPTESALHAVLQTYEKLLGTSSTLQGLQHVMDIAGADAAAARAQLSQEKSALAAQGERLSALAADVQKGSDELQREAAAAAEEEERKAQQRRKRQDSERRRQRVNAALGAASWTPTPLEEVGMNRPYLPGSAATAKKASPSPIAVSLGDHRGKRYRDHAERHALSPYKAAPLYNSPQASYYTNSEFSTDLVLFDEESVDEIAALQAALGFDSHHTTQPQRSSETHDGHHLRGGASGTLPQADSPPLGRSLSTPFTSSES